MLTPQDAEKFFHDVLHFHNWKKTKETDPKVFLKQLVQKYQYYCYFHNTEMAAVPESQRRTPTEADVIRLGTTGQGGVCVHQNSFLAYVLQAIGFTAFVSSGTCAGGNEGNHAMCILKFPHENETYALDVGCGQPVDEAIPLHNLPYTGKAGGFLYEYRYNEEVDRYERWQYDGTFFHGVFTDPKETILRYTFTLTPRNMDHFNSGLVNIFTNSANSIFLRNPFLFRSLDLDEEEKAGENGRRFILVFGLSLVIFDRSFREVTKFSSYKEMESPILKYFPKVDPGMLSIALDNISKLQRSADSDGDSDGGM